VNVVQQQVWWKNSLLWQERFFFVCLFVCVFFVFVALGLYVTQWGKGEVGKLVT